MADMYRTTVAGGARACTDSTVLLDHVTTAVARARTGAPSWMRCKADRRPTQAVLMFAPVDGTVVVTALWETGGHITRERMPAWVRMVAALLDTFSNVHMINTPQESRTS